MERRPVVIFAKYVVPMGCEPIENGAVIAEGNEIKWVGPALEGPDIKGKPLVIDARDCAVLPGLINCHAHLELTALRRVPFRGSMYGWLNRVGKAKRGRSRVDCFDSAKRGAFECIIHGTTTAVDIASDVVSMSVAMVAGLGGFILYECRGVLGYSVEGAQKLLAEGRDMPKKKPHVRFGLSAHSPLLCKPRLITAVAEDCKERGVPFSIHISETKEEFDRFTRDVDLEEKVGSGLYKKVKGKTPLFYLYVLDALTERTLAVHLNYHTKEDIKLLKKTGASVVHCPRSHRHFRHPDFKLNEFLKAGVNVALGSDSAVSNGSLNLFDEMFVLYRKGLPAKECIKMATLNGAKALGREGRAGVIKAGADANLCKVTLTKDPKDLYKTILLQGKRGKVDALLLNGRAFVGAREEIRGRPKE